MTGQPFAQRAATALDRLEAGIERAAERAGVDLEVARTDNVIEVEFDDGSRIVINSHEAAGEIWVAARSGGYHFKPLPDGRWCDTRSSSDLIASLSARLSDQAGVPIALDAVEL
ncbi:MAG: iron donor protein CyaY [Lautropia sp.]